MKGGFEQDVFTGWRKVLCYTQNAGVCKKAKKQYNKRVRRQIKLEIKFLGVVDGNTCLCNRFSNI